MANVGSIADGAAGPVPGSAAATRPRPIGWLAGMRLGDMLAVLPFILFAILFLLLPLSYLVIEAFQTQDGAFTLDNLAGLAEPKIAGAFWYSIRISATSAFNIVPILLFAQIRGDVLGDRGLGAALAVGMIIICALANVIYLVVRARAERWLK